MSGRRSAPSLPVATGLRLLWRANAGWSLLHGRSEKKPRDRRICGALSDLGLHVSRYSVRHRNDPAVSYGGRTIRGWGSDHVRDRVGARDQQIDVGELAYVVDYPGGFA